MDPQFDNFIHMVVEEYLMKKGMNNTLREFREEWIRPNDEDTLLSWYEISLKLHLPEMSNNNNNNGEQYPTVLENLSSELMSEASLRMRKPSEVIISGLATIPKPSSLPAIELHPLSTTVFEKKIRDSYAYKYDSMNETNIKKQDLNTGTELTRRYNPISKRSQENLKNKMSSSNWIPDDVRYKQLGRDFHVAKENLHDIIMRTEETRRENRALAQSDLDRAHSMESLGVKHKVECACCLQKFSYVNLRLKVSHKAIIDIRKMWNNGASGWWSAHDERWSVVPRCYDEVLVCLLCSQFFHKQAEYRPSFEQIQYDERKVAFLETKRREKEYWDPLRMCEKDRELMEEELKRQVELELLIKQQQTLLELENENNGNGNNNSSIDDTVSAEG